MNLGFGCVCVLKFEIARGEVLFLSTMHVGSVFHLSFSPFLTCVSCVFLNKIKK